MPADDKDYASAFGFSPEQVEAHRTAEAVAKAERTSPENQKRVFRLMGARDQWGKLINHDAVPRKKLDNPEGQVLSAIMEYLALRKVWCWRVNNSGMPIRDRYGNVTGMKKSTLPAGHSDIAGILPVSGKALYIEVKAKEKKPTPEQYAFIEKVKANGGVALWADDVRTVVDTIEPLLKTL